ncbi:hypothetical protein N2152v2_005872 [Parachlorella kessleri]
MTHALQVHQARVSYLAVSEDGDTLFSGCDAAAPRPVEAPDIPTAAVSSQDGKVLMGYTASRLHSIRLVLSAEPEQVTCVDDQGAIIQLHPTDGSTAAERIEAARPSITAPGQQSSPEAGLRAEQGGECCADVLCTTAEADAGAPAMAGAAAGPEFLAETGYRGVREGYLFRPGTKGLGYYRKDVVRLYAPTRPRSHVATMPSSVGARPSTTSTAPVPEAAGIDNTLLGTNGAASRHDPTAAGSQQQPLRASSSADSSTTSGTCSSTYLQRLLQAGPSLQSAVTSWDGSLLFTASLGPKDHSIRIWQLPQLTEAPVPAPGNPASAGPPQQPMLLHTLSGHTASVLSLALNPEGTLLFSGSHDYTIHVWRTSDWALVRVLKGHGGGVRALAVSPDGATLYSAAGDNTLRAWSTRAWVCLRTLHGRHEETTWPCCMALSRDGELLASGSTGLFGGCTIKVFQTRSRQGREAGTCLATFAQLGFTQKGAVSALAFSHDGRYLYSGASDGTLAKWRLEWVEPVPAGRGAGLRKGFL